MGNAQQSLAIDRAGETMRGKGGTALVPRPRLREALARARIALLEAPGGYGKSTAWAEMASGLDVPTVRVVLRRRQNTSGLLSSIALACQRAGLVALADAVLVDEPEATLDALAQRIAASERGVLFAIDEVHRADPRAASWLAEFAVEVPTNAQLVICGRRLGPSLAGLLARRGVVELGIDDLRFDLDETTAVIATVRGETPPASEAQAILAATDGWPAAVVLAAKVAITGGARGGPSTVMRPLVEGMLAGMAPETARLVEMAVGLPLLSAEVLSALGGDGAIERVLEAGLPIRFRADGWVELPDPVREIIPSRPPNADQLRAVADGYARGGELVEAAALLHRAGDFIGGLELLETQPRGALARAGLGFFDALLGDVPDQVLANHPRVLISLAQAAERLPRVRGVWLDRAERIFMRDSPEWRAIEAERVMETARAGDMDGAIGSADRILATAAPSELTTRGRAHLARSICKLTIDTANATAEARDELELAIGCFSLVDERSWEAEAHQALGYGVDFTMGAYELAAERLDRALALRPAADTARAATLTYVAEVAMTMGRLDDAQVALREAAAIAKRVGDPRTIGYVSWSAAELACERRDAEAAFAALVEAEAHGSGWFDGLAGIEFLSQAAEIRMILGDEHGALRDLLRSEARAAGTPLENEPLSARARFDVMFGDPTDALRELDILDRSALAYAGDRWQRLLLRAAATARTGGAAAAVTASALVRESRRLVTEMGDPHRLERREPELLSLAAPRAGPVSQPSTTTVTLLGRFAVERDGIDVSPPSGRPAALIKVLALQRTLSIDAAIDLLWEESDLDTGRARLRNLLNRIKAASGELVVRRDETLTLAPGLTVDAQRFEREATAALASLPETRAGLARLALAWWTGELLPGDPYADWATLPREQLRRRHLALLDLIAEDAIARGDLDEADDLLEASITADPLEEMRYVRLAQALIAQGRIRQANRVAEQGAAICADLGVEPGDDLAQVLSRLARSN